jgi:hypothetical protein
MKKSPTQTITLTATGAPAAGWTYKWYVFKDAAAAEFYAQNAASANLFVTAPQLFNNPTGSSISVTGPGSYFVQLIAPNNWKSQVRELKVENAIPENLTAINTSPAPLGGTVSLSIGQVPTATSYTWSGPAGYTATGRLQTLAALTEAQVGVYTVSIALTGGCTVTATTEVSQAGCDIYVEARNAAGTETYELSRIGAAVVTAAFEPLTLKVLPFTGTIPFDKYYIYWYKNGSKIPGAEGPSYVTSTPGKYTVQLIVKLSPSTVCEASTNINAKPCREYTNVACGGPVVVDLPNTQVAGVELAEGNKFTAGDFTIVVEKIISGSPAGYTGEGYIEMRLVADIVAKRIGVTFTNAVINTCYELAGGKVETMYDPDWKGVADVDAAIEEIKDLLSSLKSIYNKVYDEVAVIDCSAKSKSNINESIASIDEIKTNFSTIFDVSPTVAAPFQTKLTEISASITCKVQETCPANGGRVSNTSTDCGFIENKQKFEVLFCEIADLKKVFENSNLFLPPSGNREKYYYTPSGKLVSLPFDAKPRFGTSTSLKVHPSALVGFEIITGNPEFGPPGIYDGRYLGNDFEGYQKRGSSDKKLYVFGNQSPNSLVDNQGKLSVDIVLSFVNATGVPAAGLIEKGYTFSELVRDLGLVLESSPQYYFRPFAVGSAAALFACLMIAPANYASFTNGEGALADDLPVLLFDPQAATKVIQKPIVDVNTFPALAKDYTPVKYVENCFTVSSQKTCGVYVITGPNFSRNPYFNKKRPGQFDIAKYGMTCNLNGPRPQKQVNSFNTEHATQISLLKFDWNWVVKGLSALECYAMEKDLTGHYALKNEGRLPWKHGLPKFKDVEVDQLTGWEDELDLAKRLMRIREYLRNRNNGCN